MSVSRSYELKRYREAKALRNECVECKNPRHQFTDGKRVGTFARKCRRCLDRDQARRTPNTIAFLKRRDMARIELASMTLEQRMADAAARAERFATQHEDTPRAAAE